METTSFMHDLVFYGAAVVTAFLAGFIDSVAGGGGTIQIPALLLLGVPPIMTLGTNKMVAFCGTAAATWRYSRSITMPWKSILWAVPVAAVFSFGGAKTILLFNPVAVKKIIVFALPAAFILMLILSHRKTKPHVQSDFRRGPYFICTAIFAFYDGYFGPGTGTFLTTTYNKLARMPFVLASACAKPINLTGNIGALIVFVVAGEYRLDLALPMIGFNMLGAYVGSSCAIRLGEVYVKRMLILTFGLLIVANYW